MRDRKSRTDRRKREGKRARIVKQEQQMFHVYEMVNSAGVVCARGTQKELIGMGYKFN